MASQRARVVSTESKIVLIKLIRQLTGVRLEPAKALVEQHQWFEFTLDEHTRALIDEHCRAFATQLEFDPPLDAAPDAPEFALDPALIDPSFELRASVRYVSGRNKIQAIKLVRSLTPGLGLKQAKDLVDAAGLIHDNISYAEATQIAEQFAELGSQVEVIPHSITLIAYDPQHPARGDQPLVRMRITGPQLALDRGRLGAWSTDQSQQFADLPALRRAVEDQKRDWAAAGLALTGDPLEFIARVSAHDPTLEHELRSADDPREPALVFADWLQAQGDPRGQLGPLQDAGLEAEAAALLERHANHLFGPLAPHLELVELGWTAGVVTRLELQLSGPVPGFGSGLELFTGLMSLPVLACVRALELTGPWLNGTAPLAGVAHKTLAGLRSLALTNPGWGNVELGDWQAFTRLEQLRVNVGAPTLGALTLPKLHSLSLSLGLLHLDEDLAQAFVDGDLSALTELELEFAVPSSLERGLDDYINALRMLLDAPTLTTLRHVRVHVEDGELDERLVASICGARCIGGLERLEFVDCSFSPEAQALLEQQRQRLRCELVLS